MYDKKPKSDKKGQSRMPTETVNNVSSKSAEMGGEGVSAALNAQDAAKGWAEGDNVDETEQVLANADALAAYHWPGKLVPLLHNGTQSALLAKGTERALRWGESFSHQVSLTKER